ncbi:chemotaxis protein CheB [Arcticibacter eurypsychrophilus]|uniref:chemotaxis protein CheB n=1 Tax=Arcticibacter eurypsychrophilus TaxID=1434752 RepID=UPI00084CFBB6|nr:chemotaxis protein CheB [Arcticibacter eurypsychrophilus]
MSSCRESKIRKARVAKVLLQGCSAGSFNLVFELVKKKSLNFPLSVVVVIHRSRKYSSFIEEILDRNSDLKVALADVLVLTNEGILLLLTVLSKKLFLR